MTQEFKTTGSSDIREQIAALSDDMLEPTQRLEKLLRAEVADKQFSELTGVTYHHDGATLAGHALLDALETAGFSIDDFDAVGAMTAAGIPLVSAMIHAAASRGQLLDGFLMDFVFPGIKGPSIKDKRVILIDAWLSEKSFVQTSSVVTLTHGNELNLDFAVLENEGARIVAIASLVGSTGVLENYTEQKKQNLSDILGTSDADDTSHTCSGHCEHEGSEETEPHECTCGGHGHCSESKNSDTAESAQFIKLVNPITENVTRIPFIPVFSDKELQKAGE
ncbi:hypothetical protein [Alloscardovia macacae]|uniref:Orotate phosphoribosyltransferase n=1 Tax=Alloscardovia macacae TaxID=1160091 RepID=A0A261F695_9BIFI|nr:hypothetical protein ALMA_0458 [Alloscardovia macacae]